MAQKQFSTYKSNASSFERLEAVLGALEPGRYRGFDTIGASVATPPAGSIAFVLGHDTTGVVKTDIDGNFTDATGVALTKQGQMIHDDTPLEGLSEVNTANGFVRLDLVVLEHQYVLVAGANPATLVVIKGVDGGPLLPVATNPELQTILGYLSWGANGTTLADVTFTPQAVPLFANQLIDILTLYGGVLNTAYARLATDNTLQGAQTIIKRVIKKGPTTNFRNAASEATPINITTVGESLTLTQYAGNTFVIAASVSTTNTLRKIYFDVGHSVGDAIFLKVGGSNPIKIIHTPVTAGIHVRNTDLAEEVYPVDSIIGLVADSSYKWRIQSCTKDMQATVGEMRIGTDKTKTISPFTLNASNGGVFQRLVPFTWDMDTVNNIKVDGGSVFNKIVGVRGMLYDGGLTVGVPIFWYDNDAPVGASGQVGVTAVTPPGGANVSDISLWRVTSGSFDSPTYNAATGYLIVDYIL